MRFQETWASFTSVALQLSVPRLFVGKLKRPFTFIMDSNYKFHSSCCNVRLFIATFFFVSPLLTASIPVSPISLKSVRIFIILINKFSLKVTQNARDGKLRFSKLLRGSISLDPPRSLSLWRSFCSKSVTVQPRGVASGYRCCLVMVLLHRFRLASETQISKFVISSLA